MSDFYELSANVDGFYFTDFQSLQSAYANGNLEVNAAPDFARQWLYVDQSAPTFPKLIVKLHAVMLLLFPIIWLVLAFVEGAVLWGVLAFLTPLFYIFLRPITVILGVPHLRLLIFCGYCCVLGGLLGWFGGWALPVGFTIVAPWLANKFTYELSHKTALKIALQDEHSFVKLFKSGVVSIRTQSHGAIFYREIRI